MLDHARTEPDFFQFLFITVIVYLKKEKMSVIGLDVGNENCVVAVAEQAGINVVLNGESRRETPAMVSFGEKQRYLGSAAAALATMNPKSTVSQLKRIIGRRFDDPEVQYDLTLMPFCTSCAADGGVLIDVGEDKTFTPTQILGTILSHLKQIAVKNLETPSVFGSIIGIPSYFTKLQRRAYIEATAIAKLGRFALMHEPTAISLAYGIDKMDLPDEYPINVVFVDIGHSDTQVSVAAFRKGELKMLSHAFDRCLGGRDFDEVLFNHFADKFKEEYEIDVRKNVRASLRLRVACEKLKKVLSANSEAHLNIESLMDEKDVSGFITREEFERLSEHLLEKLKIPCVRALEEAQSRSRSLVKIYDVEVVGSGSRIPAVVRVLGNVFGREPSRTLNASESIARGCALQCAMLKPTYRGRVFQVEDCFPFPVALCWKQPVLETDEGNTETRSDEILFPTGYPISRLASTKIPTFTRNDTFTLDAVYADTKDLPPGTCTKISTFTIGPFQASKSEKPKIEVEFCLNLYEIVTVESASLEKRKSRTDLQVNEVINGGLSQEELQNAIEKEFELANQDRITEETKEKKNAVESYVYDMRNKLLDIYRNCATDSEREELSRKLRQTEDWLYEEGDDVSKEVYIAKLEELKNIVDPIEQSYKEEVQQMSFISFYQKLAQSRDLEFDHIDPKEIEKLIRCIEKLQQHSRSDEIRKNAESLKRCLEQILSKTKQNSTPKSGDEKDRKQNASHGGEKASESMDIDHDQNPENKQTE